jgi:hypothetical protein
MKDISDLFTVSTDDSQRLQLPFCYKTSVAPTDPFAADRKTDHRERGRCIHRSFSNLPLSSN